MPRPTAHHLPRYRLAPWALCPSPIIQEALLLPNPAQWCTDPATQSCGGLLSKSLQLCILFSHCKKNVPHLQLAFLFNFLRVAQVDQYMPSSEQHFLNTFVSRLILNTLVHPNIEFQLQLWSQDISGNTVKLGQVWLAKLRIAKACSQTCFPRKTTISCHKGTGKWRGRKWLRKQSHEYLYTWPACLLVFHICNLRKTLCSSPRVLLPCFFFWVLKAQIVNFLCFKKCRAFSPTSNL